MTWQDQATEKQLAFINDLQLKLNRVPKDFTGINRRQAKELIDSLQDELQWQGVFY
jgi:hypothetical protein